MTKMKFIFLFLFSAIVIYSSNFQDFLDRVNSISSLTDKQTVVDSFINYAQGIGIPYIENYTANFLYRGNTPSAAVAGDHNGWNGSAMTKLTGTNLWYQSLEFENDARIDYKLVINGKKHLMNNYIGQHISIEWEGKVICGCGKSFNKFYRSGFF